MNVPKARSKDTIPERKVRSLLHALGYRFRLHVKELPGTPDIVLKKYRTTILVHGCFWHRHKNCPFAFTPKTNVGYWNPKLRHNVARDKENISSLNKLGWKVIVIWTCELRHINQIITRIKKELPGLWKPNAHPTKH